MTKDAALAQYKSGMLSKGKERLLELLLEKRTGKTQKITAVPREQGAATFRLRASAAQERLWFIDQLEGGSEAYYIPLSFRLRGRLDHAGLQAALNAVVKRHEVLRTNFVKVEGDLVQQIRSESHFPLQYSDLRSTAPQAREAEKLRQSHDDLAMPFKLSAGPLIRGRLLQFSDDEHVLLITMHHIVSDGWSVGVLIRDLGTLYQQFLNGEADSLPSLPVQYADYAQWQREWLKGAVLQEQLAYWNRHLLEAPGLLELPTDRPRPAVRSYRGGIARVALGGELSAELAAISRRQGLTLAMTLHAAWALVLSRLSGQNDIVIGVPVANRRHTEVEGLIGFFVNTLAVRVELDGDPEGVVLLRRVKDALLGAYAHQDAPFERVVEMLKPERSLSYSPIFQVVFVMHNAPRAVLQSGLTIVNEDVPLHTSKFDLTLSLQESAEGIVGSLSYAADLFDDTTIQRWIGYFTAALRGLVWESHRQVSGLQLMDDDERHSVTAIFNATHTPYPHESLIHQLFEAQVERTPDCAAVEYGKHSLTYAQLNGKANQLARYLRGKGVGPDQLVAMYLERGVDMITALLGIMKAGAAYVPLDPDHPSMRIANMLEDAAPRLLLVQEKSRETFSGVVADVVALDSEWEQIARHPSDNICAAELGLSSRHLAYVIYTSGSTGLPKGVMIEHGNVASLLSGLERIYQDLGSCQRVGVNASLSFDASVKQVVQLLAGRTLVLVSAEIRRDAATFLQFMDEQRIDAIDCTPAQLSSWLSAGLLEQPDGPLRLVLVGGEPIDAKLWSSLAQSRKIKFYNVYGPTESTVDSTFACLTEDARSPHIGRPMDNRAIYILDAHGHPVPLGVPGEMHIGGAGIARGYLNRPELTAEKFIPDPFGVDTQARLYKTGDEARWRPDGTIEYVGRRDHQVKIRGFRIELGEIEAQLRRYQAVHAAAVIAREDVPGDKRLVAYVVPRAASCVPSVEELRVHLKSVLPEYMVPSAFVMLDSLPQTVNGKLARKALPIPDIAAYTTREYQPPQGDVEEMLASIWESLLRVDRVGRHDNFFELGGHSLLVVQMMERVRRAGFSAEVRRVFDSPTLAALAGALTSESLGRVDVPPNLIPAGCATITPQMLTLVELNEQHIDEIAQAVPGGAANIQDIYPLAPLQEGILFHHLLSDGGGDAYIVPLLLSVSSRQRMQQLISALQAVIDRHDILRTAVLWERLPQPVQVVYRQAVLPVEELALDRQRDIDQQVKEWMQPQRQQLDLRHAPLMRLQVAEGDGGRWYALLQTHHITSDHVTLEIITAEVVAHLEGQSHLPASEPYRNHVAQTLACSRTRDTEEFFRRKLEDIDEPTAPFGLLDVHGDGSRIEQADQAVEPVLSNGIRVQARRLEVTPATLFHAAWALVVAHTSGHDDVVFGSVLLGRLQGSAGAQRILGTFINTLPLRLQLHDLTAVELVRRTQQELIGILMHEQASLALAQRCSGVVGSAPLFTALFNYRHSAANPEAQWSRAQGLQLLQAYDLTNYPITLSVDDDGREFTLTAQTDRRIDPRRLTGYLHTAVQSLVAALERTPLKRALALPILPDAEREQVVAGFQEKGRAYAPQVSIHQLFEEQAQRTPDAIAVEHGIEHLTYAQIDGEANQLARHLKARGIGPDKLVGLCAERSIDMVIGLLGILKAGGAYLPLDPSYPIDRLHYMLEDAAPSLVLVQGKLAAALPATTAPLVRFDREAWHEIGARPPGKLSLDQPTPSAENLIYVIYTSGSTGRPKGTAMPHGAMVNLIEWHRQTLGIGRGQRVLQFAALSFDVAFQEIFSTLCTGATLVLLDEWTRKDTQALTEVLIGHSIERLFVPPLMLQSLAEHHRDGGEIAATLKDVIVAGEQLRITAEIVDFFKSATGRRLHNHYGPTETHVVTALTLPDNPALWPVLPAIGRPIAKTQLYITDRLLQPVPIDVPGEIYIGGANVARGYLSRPELTAQRFICDPFSADARSRLYKTGDLGRWRRDGTIEYLQRNDDQVKVRGFRVELGEIEAQLARHAQIKAAAVIVREDVPGEKRIVAYVSMREQSDATLEDLRAHIKSALPDFMVPTAFVTVDSMPVTPSGKLNRRALPAPEASAYASREYTPPQGRVEELLAQIWQELLSLGRVGRDDNFFEIGGHSLLVLKALSRINQAFGASVRVGDVYKSPTIRELAECINGTVLEDKVIDLSREATLGDLTIGVLARPSLPARTILLTGGTGFVGRFLLAQLLADTDATIYCVVRGASESEARVRLRAALMKWDLWRDQFDARIVAVAGNLRLPQLGIEETTYQKLARRVDAIYHCATSMNHLETYAMAKSANVGSARELLKLATRDRAKVINYISTMGIFGASASGIARVVDETTSIDHERHVNSRGYIASKWVGEKIFMEANKRQVPCNIFRVGLVWGDARQGRYDELQRGYRMVKSCLLSGYGISGYGFDLPPTPVDYVARAIVFLGGRRHDGGGVFHISSAGWKLENVFEKCNEILGTSLELMSFYEWIGAMKRLHQAGRSMPVVPLIDYAFSMGEEAFHEHQRKMRPSIQFDCARTHRELESAGIVAPESGENLLQVSVQSMLSRDPELCEVMRQMQVRERIRAMSSHGG